MIPLCTTAKRWPALRCRVGILIARFAVGGPARMPDTHRLRVPLAAVDAVSQHLQTALGLAHRKAAGIQQRHAGRVIARYSSFCSPSSSSGAAGLYPINPTIPHMAKSLHHAYLLTVVRIRSQQ